MSRPKKDSWWIEIDYEESEPIKVIATFGVKIHFYAFPFTNHYYKTILNITVFKEHYKPATEEEMGLFYLKFVA